MITKQQAIDEREFHLWNAKAGKCFNWRRNGQTRTWKRDETRWELPVKYGLRGYDTITADHDGDALFVARECPHH